MRIAMMEMVITHNGDSSNDLVMTMARVFVTSIQKPASWWEPSVAGLVTLPPQMLSVKMEKKNASKCTAEAPIATKPINSYRDSRR